MTPRGQRFRKTKGAEDGIAAVEFALVLPMMVILFLLLTDAVRMVTTVRKLTLAASTAADLITQYTSTVTSTQIDDIIAGTGLIMRPVPAAQFRIEIRAYRDVAGTVTLRWTKQSAGAPDCADPVPAALVPLLAANGVANDVVVAVTCTTVRSFATEFIKELVGQSVFTYRRQVAMRPRQTTTLDCTGC